MEVEKVVGSEVIGSGSLPESVARRFLESEAGGGGVEVGDELGGDIVELDAISEGVEPESMDDVLYRVAESAAKGELTVAVLVEALRSGPPVEDVRLIVLLRVLMTEQPGKSFSQTLLEAFVDLGLGPIAEEAIEVAAVMGAGEASALASVEGVLPAVSVTEKLVRNAEYGKASGTTGPELVLGIDEVSAYPYQTEDEPEPATPEAGDVAGDEGDDLSIEISTEGTPSP